MNPPSLRLPLYVGIDPGFSGAVGVIDQRGWYKGVWDMPTTGGAGRSREIDLEELGGILRALSATGRVDRVYLEWVSTRPGESPESSKRFGVGLGVLEGMCSVLGIVAERVSPNGWKGRLGLMGKAGQSRDAREQAVTMAEELIQGMPPGTLRGPRRGAKDGRAEALLIAWDGLTRTYQGLRQQPEDVRMARALLGGSRRRKGRGPTI